MFILVNLSKMVVSHLSSFVFFITECRSCAQYFKWDLVGSVHQVTLSNLFSSLLYVVRPSFFICRSRGSMCRISYKLICGVDLVKLVVRRQAGLFKLFSFWCSSLVFILFPHVRQAYVNLGLTTPV